mmetsp:Transcript_45064/g.86177  ORF Transcript_45064/g.86177 Transcript_45064/m.86177 type:complete len:159 (+) Transcript_45064:357-833(+)|eukprot:CAMPEP_0114250024 /NCGR_PEP_ID=MMETSP0058-20121206/14474_1 /TAXON_ID=36894 /ORGANISM="Pyramimonas parkeae, CCMP726" /LENGTH=158 /DNA_ID=CAMNT_0001363647 /DNA_START=350 /DNA_END=826 /DNA_ORIENTATION=+
MSHKGSQEMRKQYGRQEVAFNLLEPERRARPGLDYTCTKHSSAVTALDKEIGRKASSQDPRTKPTPLNTMQPGLGYQLSTSIGAPGLLSMGRQNCNQGNAVYRMGGQSSVPGTLSSTSLSLAKSQVNMEPSSNSQGLSGRFTKTLPRHNPITGEMKTY